MCSSGALATKKQNKHRRDTFVGRDARSGGLHVACGICCICWRCSLVRICSDAFEQRQTVTSLWNAAERVTTRLEIVCADARVSRVATDECGRHECGRNECGRQGCRRVAGAVARSTCAVCLARDRAHSSRLSRPSSCSLQLWFDRGLDERRRTHGTHGQLETNRQNIEGTFNARRDRRLICLQPVDVSSRHSVCFATLVRVVRRPRPFAFAAALLAATFRVAPARV